jgi:alkylation response protein AidB-like acyl-CoA dehydrogenase
LLGGVTPPIIYRMDFDLSDEQRAFQDTAREFARDEWLPYAPGWDEREEFPEEALR